MKIKIAVAALGLWAVCGITPLFAHHAFEAEFDTKKAIHIEGKVTKVEWGNPHVYGEMDVPNKTVGVVNWRFELTSPNDLSRSGMTRNTMRVGSEIAVDGFAAKSGERLVGTMDLTFKSTGLTISEAAGWARFAVRPLVRPAALKYSIPDASWHHSFSVEFDNTKPIELKGNVVSVDWRNPYVQVYFTATKPNGERQVWSVTTMSMSLLIRSGWKPADVGPGDVIQVEGYLARDGSAKLMARNVSLFAKGGMPLALARRLLTNQLN